MIDVKNRRARHRNLASETTCCRCRSVDSQGKLVAQLGLRLGVTAVVASLRRQVIPDILPGLLLQPTGCCACTVLCTYHLRFQDCVMLTALDQHLDSDCFLTLLKGEQFMILMCL